MPLERDEGEYAYAAWLINQGIPPYKQIYNMKLPGIYYAYALIIRSFGESPESIRAAFLAIHVLTILILFLLARRLFDNSTALLAAASFACFSLNPFTHSFFAQAEHLVVFFSLVSLLTLSYASQYKGSSLTFTSGLGVGMAVLMKQHAAVFGAFALTLILLQELKTIKSDKKKIFSRLSTFIAGAALPLTIAGLYFLSQGLFDRFLFWTVVYARQYVSLVSPEEGWSNLVYTVSSIAAYSPILMLSAGLGLVASCGACRSIPGDWRIFLWLFTLFSILTVTPGFYFREHYFLMVLPAASLLSGITLAKICRFLKVKRQDSSVLLPILFLIFVFGGTIIPLSTYLFRMNPVAALRLTHSLNPFPEAMPIARYIKARTHPEDIIAVIGSEPQIYFYAQRLAATGYIYTYPLMEPHPFALDMQKEMIREIEIAVPKYLVFVHIPSSWLMQTSSETMIFTWFSAYSAQYYRLCGLIEIRSETDTVYYWDDEARRRRPSASLWVSVHERWER